MGEWEVNQAEDTLCLGDRSVRLEPRVMDVLVYLAAEPGRVVPKEELLKAVWGGAFVEEGALSQAVHSLRKVLGDDARQSRFIQTIPKRGYRLAAPVTSEATEIAQAPLSRPQLDLRPSSASLVAAPTRPTWRSRHRVLLILAAIGLAAVIAVWFGWDYLRLDRDQPRIVVLPFENLGRPEDAFFADGLTEEITKDLYSLRSLRVISRTTAMLYAGARKPLPQIGQELKVDYVLEGTVRWAKGPDGRPRVRITPQLIRVTDDAHIWADAFEREVGDIFKVQAEISRKVIAALGVTLAPEEERMPRGQPPENLDAFRAYVRGLQLKNQPFYSESHLRNAEAMFERAVALDPGFAAAWAELSQTHSYLAFNADRSPVRVEKARQTLEKALDLAPDLPDVRIAQAYFTYRCLEDFDLALEQLSSAARLFPNDSGVLLTLGLVLRRKGRLGEAIEALQDASVLNPRSVEVVWPIAETYRALREYEQADQFYARAISMAPDESSFWAERALNRLAWRGETGEARAILGRAAIPASPILSAAAFQLDLYDREYERALARLSPEALRGLSPQDQSRLGTLEVLAYERKGDRRRALEKAEANRSELQSRVARFPKEPLFRAYLAVALAHLGRDSEALWQVEQAVRLKSHDSFTGPRMVQIQAMVEARLGRRREAVIRLGRLLDTPYRMAICTAELRLDPVWDALRDDPVFERLVRRSER